MSEEYLQRRKRQFDSISGFNPVSYFQSGKPSVVLPSAPPPQGQVTWRQRFNSLGDRGRSSFAAVASTVSAFSFFSGFFSYLFYLSIITFFIFMILIVVHYTVTPIFKFDLNGAGNAPLDLSKGTSDGQLTWTSIPALPDLSPNPPFQNLLNSEYTISLDVYSSPSFSMMQTPRVLLYRSASPKTLTATMDISKILTTFTDSNLILYIDSMKNDLYILTQTTTTNGQTTPEPLPVITNVPMGIPFRVGIIFTSNYVEVYINGKLEATRILKGTLIGSAGTTFYSPPSMVSSSVKVANLHYWSRILTPSELRSVGPVLPNTSFFANKS